MAADSDARLTDIEKTLHEAAENLGILGTERPEDTVGLPIPKSMTSIPSRPLMNRSKLSSGAAAKIAMILPMEINWKPSSGQEAEDLEFEIENVESDCPFLYLEPLGKGKGRLKLFGAWVYPRTRYIAVNSSTGKKLNVLGDYRRLLVFPHYCWIGTEEENKEQIPLDLPKEFLVPDVEKDKELAGDFAQNLKNIDEKLKDQLDARQAMLETIEEEDVESGKENKSVIEASQTTQIDKDENDQMEEEIIILESQETASNSKKRSREEQDIDNQPKRSKGDATDEKDVEQPAQNSIEKQVETQTKSENLVDQMKAIDDELEILLSQ